MLHKATKPIRWSMNTVTDEINNAVTGMDQRLYEPRELNELFDF